jgi:hypothetical protein
MPGPIIEAALMGQDGRQLYHNERTGNKKASGTYDPVEKGHRTSGRDGSDITHPKDVDNQECSEIS